MSSPAPLYKQGAGHVDKAVLRFGLFPQVQPLAVEDSVAVYALVGVRTEIIPLCLEQVRRQSGESIAVVVREGR